ncbi:hypothetical protein [Nocardia callitridis]|uniref:Uncharacterized protein n=1 Tax=Nocardia callitridis TaxID=648753 RepID=A0ABP9K3M0_9NOCA
MTSTVTRTADGLVLGNPPERQERTALLEAAGAMLVWDCAVDGLPAAFVWDPGLALDWAWQIYGPEVTPALTGETEAFFPAPGPAAGPARLAARAGWARAWWPASVRASIPPLDPRLIALERACALADVEHLLDDDNAAAASLAEGLRAAGRLRVDASLPTEIRSSLDELVERVEAAAEDHGVRAAEADPAPSQPDYALAAGTLSTVNASTAGAGSLDALASGAVPLDLSAFAPGTVDAAARGHWSVVREGADTVLEVSVARAPVHPAERGNPAPLEARFAEVGLLLEPEPSRFAGRTPVAATILLTRPEKRTLTVASRGYGGGGRVDAAALIDAAQILLGQARDTAWHECAILLAERAAALRP